MAGSDGVGRTTAPLGEFFHPLPLAALVLLALNDHVLKGSGLLPGWLTGKLSDFAGLCFFPLLLTAGADTLAWLLLRKRVDFSLRFWKLGVAIGVTGAVFALLELSPRAARGLDEILGGHTVADPTDLLALVGLGAAFWVGRGEIARVPLGRLEVIQHRAGSADAIARALADVARLRGEAPVRRLADALASGDRAGADAALAVLRR